MSRPPRVSVVVSHYDRQDELPHCLESIARQEYRDFEVIVVNDCGADSAAIVRPYARRFPLTYDYRPANAGVAATRNRGVALACGELVAYLDDDDRWRPRHLAALVAALDADPGAGLAYGDAEVELVERPDAGGGAGGGMEGGVGGVGGEVVARLRLAVPFDLEDLKRDDFIVPGGMVHRRSLYDAVGPFDTSLAVSDDWDWLLRAVRVTRFVRAPEIVVAVRIGRDGSNLSASGDVRRLAALRKIERRHGTPPLLPKTFWEVAQTYAGRRGQQGSEAGF